METFLTQRRTTSICFGIAVLMLIASRSFGQSATADSSLASVRSPKHGGVYVVAHRGAHDEAPENTMIAYQRAIDMGCDFIEVDVRTTRDQHLVCIHDATLERYTEGKNKTPVSQLTLAELQKIDIGGHIHKRFSGERVPTLVDVLKLCKGQVGIYLDVKAASIENLHGAVAAYEMEQDTLWYLPSNKVEQLRQRSDRCFAMPDPGPEMFLPSLLHETHPRVVASVWRYFSPEFAKTCHEAQAVVFVDDNGPETWERLLEWGADGIQTDSPAQLIDFLERVKK